MSAGVPWPAAHRPWPVPDGRWTFRMSWLDLLFAHWKVDPSIVRGLVPDALDLDLRDGAAWVGLVPFRMEDVMFRGLPAVPGLSAFPEVNVRTYVTAGGKPGVWFMSLDATNPIAVWGARTFVHLPYFRATMSVRRDGDAVDYSSHRAGAELAMSYRPDGDVALPVEGTLEHWLTERYCLYAQAPDGGIRRTEIHHAPWPLQPAQAHLERNTLVRAGGVDVHGAPDHLCFARRQDVVGWNPVRV